MARGAVLFSVALGLLVTNACTNVAGLTGYDFGEAGAASDADVPPTSDAAKTDGPTGADAGVDAADAPVACDFTFPGSASATKAMCENCINMNCCSEGNKCDSPCKTSFASSPRCSTGTPSAVSSCSMLESCVANFCAGKCTTI